MLDSVDSTFVGLRLTHGHIIFNILRFPQWFGSLVMLGIPQSWDADVSCLGLEHHV